VSSSDFAICTPAEDELTLARRVASGDRAAFELLMRRYNRRLYRLARASLRDDSEAKDALQEAYLNAYRAIGSFRGDATLSTWLSRLVLNECGVRQRRAARRRDIIPLVSADTSRAETESVADVAEGPDRAAARTQLRGILESKLSELPEALRVVFVLRSVEELSVAETAEALGIAQETVRVRHFRAKGMLREALAREIDLAKTDLFEFGGAHCDRVIASVSERLASLGLLPPIC
jgi:RNA polymerase sigma-70 factor (ECF subfamily)